MSKVQKIALASVVAPAAAVVTVGSYISIAEIVAARRKRIAARDYTGTHRPIESKVIDITADMCS